VFWEFHCFNFRLHFARGASIFTAKKQENSKTELFNGLNQVFIKICRLAIWFARFYRKPTMQLTFIKKRLLPARTGKDFHVSLTEMPLHPVFRGTKNPCRYFEPQ
jgi:hypothetical protein